MSDIKSASADWYLCKLSEWVEWFPFFLLLESCYFGACVLKIRAGMFQGTFQKSHLQVLWNIDECNALIFKSRKNTPFLLLGTLTVWLAVWSWKFLVLGALANGCGEPKYQPVTLPQTFPDGTVSVATAEYSWGQSFAAVRTDVVMGQGGKNEVLYPELNAISRFSAEWQL